MRSVAMLPADFSERVYAGVLGKIIGVYLGRPFEQWSNERIERELGEITNYVHERLGKPLIVADDDVTGTFTFFRAFTDNHCDAGLTPAQIGDAWLNYIIEGRTILWWGGIGISTEHTAWHRLASGVQAPESGSIARNGRTVAEQIGAQIFIDAWGLLNPGDPERAADFARRAASVSHDGEAIFGAQVVAALIAAAFVERDIDRLIDIALAQIPADCGLRRMIDDVRGWHAAQPDDWRATLRRIQERYGYDKFGGGCHIVPNHALIHLGLLHGRGDFGGSQRIVNTAGWDTDCNAANLGCILGVRNGLAGFEGGVDWRGPVADRLLLPTAEGGGAVSDALREAGVIVNAARALRGLPPGRPKGGARFHFEMPGAVQGFRAEDGRLLMLENRADTRGRGRRMLVLRYEGLGGGKVARAVTPTFPEEESRRVGSYGVSACPSLYPGQNVRAGVFAGESNGAWVAVGLCIQTFDTAGRPTVLRGEMRGLAPGEAGELAWVVPETGGYPVVGVGIELSAEGGETTRGEVSLDWLDWRGAPAALSLSPCAVGEWWKDAWVSSVAGVSAVGEEREILIHHGRGIGLLTQGTREWDDYEFSVEMTIRLAKTAGVVVRAQGLRRYYALVVGEEGRAQLIKRMNARCDVLATAAYSIEPGQTCAMRLRVRGNALEAWVGESVRLAARDENDPLTGGACGFLVEEGSLSARHPRVVRCSTE
jgi:ADP-ribosylglycohydrolase